MKKLYILYIMKGSTTNEKQNTWRKTANELIRLSIMFYALEIIQRLYKEDNMYFLLYQDFFCLK